MGIAALTLTALKNNAAVGNGECAFFGLCWPFWLTYSQFAEKLKEHGLSAETEASIKAKLRRGTFAATFLLATLAALEMEGFRLEDL